MGRTVSTSVVFTDLVGSTELASRVGPEESEQLRQVHFGLLRNAFAATDGSEVKNLGDGLMVVFPSVGAAIEGSIAAQHAVERRNRRSVEPLLVRIGISTGDAVEEDGDYFGETVVEAARLCAVAAGGEILATEVVALLARSSGHRFESVGPVELKGLPAPVPAVRVVWSAEPTEPDVALPLRIAAAAGDGSEFVGRAEEMRSLHDALDATQSGEPRVVFVAGEPGIGKTSLVARFARSVHATGAVVLYGRCDEELAVPYQPWVEAIGHLVDHAPDAVVRAHVDREGAHLSRLLPRLQLRPAEQSLGPTDAETERYLMYQAVWALLDAVSTDAPVVVILDDLHWSDAPTLALLRHLAASPMATPPLLVGTYRDTDVGRAHPLTDALASLRRQGVGFRRLSLRGLAGDEIARMVAAAGDRPPGPEVLAFAEALRRETNGNPFFTREILRDLVESGDVVDGPDGWASAELIDPDRLPESVLAVVRQRVARLGDDVLRALTAASIIGRDFGLSLLSHALDQPEDAVLDTLDRAVAASVIDEVEGRADCYTFTHALAQHAMESDLSSARRRRWHRRIAESIEDLWPGDPGERVGELASHWLAATVPVDAERALYYADLAGRRALEALAPDEALRWFRAALDLVDEAPAADGAARCRLLVLVGTAQRQVGDPSYRETLLEAAGLARQVGDTRSLVDAALMNNRGYHSNSGETDLERVDVLEAALEAVGEDDSAQRALLLATLCAESNVHRPPDELQRLADESLAMARRLGDARTISEVISRTRVAVYFLETIGERFEIYAEGRRLADDVGDPVVRFHAAQALLWAAAARADMSTFDDQLSAMAEIAERTGQPILQWMTRYTEAMRAAIAGETDRSEQLAAQALDIGLESGQPDALTFYGGQILRVRMMQGRLEELSVMIEDLAEENAAFPVFRAVRAAASVHAGDVETAAALLESEMERGFDGIHEMQWATAMTQWCEAAIRLDHRDAAALLYPLLVPFVSLTAFTGLTYGGPLAHYAGTLALVIGDLDAAERCFGTAVAMEARDGDPYMGARTSIGRARVAMARRRAGGAPELSDHATALLDDARASAERWGFGEVRQRAVALLAEASELR